MNTLKQSYFIVERHLPGRFTDGTFRDHDPYLCLWCSVEFETAEDLRLHAKVSHRGSYSDHGCFMCTAKFASSSRQMSHVDLVHKKLRPYRCLRCGKCYYASHDLLRHVQREHNHVKYVCDECGVVFRGDCELRSHYLKTHRCRIKFKGILGPEIEYKIPLAKNSRSVDAPTTKQRIKSARIMERIKMKYEAPPAVVVKQERIIWNDGERRVAKKSTGGGGGGKGTSNGDASPLGTNRANILPSSSSNPTHLAKKSTSKPAGARVAPADENSPRVITGKKRFHLAKKSTTKLSNSTSPHGTRTRISNGFGGQPPPGSSSINASGKNENENVGAGVNSVNGVTSSSPRRVNTGASNTNGGSSSEKLSGRKKTSSGSPNKSTVTFANTEYTLLTPNVILDSDSPPPPMKIEPGEEIERKLTLYGCMYCQRKCANVELVVAHLNEKHGIVMDANRPVSYHWNLSYLCTHCDEAFEEESKVEEHLLTHNEVYAGFDAGGAGSSINYDDMSDCILLD